MLDNLRNELISSYYDNSVLLNTSLSVDKFFDEVAMLYVYPNWYDGEVIAGPSVKRYWVTMILKFDHKKMPDPDGGMVLVKLGCKVFYKKFKQKVEVEVKDKGDLDSRGRPKTKIEPCWLVKIVIPKKFLKDEKLDDLELDNEDVDVEDIQDSMNDGLHDASYAQNSEGDKIAGANAGNAENVTAGVGE